MIIPVPVILEYSLCLDSYVYMHGFVDSHFNDRYPNFTIVCTTIIHLLTATPTLHILPYCILQGNNPDFHLR